MSLNLFVSHFPRVLAALFLVTALAGSAEAQIYETVGTRAQGMAGAFVAVADDASATWWNPAGLATGAYFGLILERGQLTEPANRLENGSAWRQRTSSFSAAFPAMGLSYYRLRISEIRPSSPTAEEDPGRQDGGAVGTDLRSMAASQYGITILQTVSQGFVIGSTLKLIRGGVAQAPAAESGDPFDRADELETSGETHGDLDVGVMASTSSARVGLSVKHLSEPEFGEGVARVKLKRQARAGLAVLVGTHGALDAATLAVDLDLTKTATATGEAEHVAGGMEAWFFGRRLGLRGGVSHNRATPSGTSTSAGLSLGLRSSMYLDGAMTFGNDETRDGWSASVRVAF
jgi:hypothetical protein